MSLELYFVCHETKTAVLAGEDALRTPYVWDDCIPSINRFLAQNKGKSFVWMFDEDKEFEKVEASYTIITESGDET